ncbi:ABC transporter substrate-binding protein [Bradyrhizobium sp. CB82]|uniref:ABC transporter substrate-binding protein n=1 Tax=Bradyrhizobium sp. CB82 TaxID=3039159 RepID=UPI0024B24EB5|nr:ABC transporter substrate-binding protein [Bradyrhizobium sp. CB82]WFU40020.1 ABC transporter substrate-binding protein [Bradyrhizobium sp. CB82]
MISTYGGSYQESQIKAVLDPFTNETGIKVQFIPYPGFDKLKAMQLTGNVELDVYLCSGAEAAAGTKQGFWEKLDPSRFDLEDLKIQPADDYAAFDIWSRGVSWNPKKFGAKAHPATFTDFFDLQKFPGRRVVRVDAQLTLEAALLGDGVAPKDIYPLNLDCAFKALDRIKSQIVWAATAPQDTSLLQVGEADFGLANCVRVEATTQPGGGVPLAYSFEQNIFGGLCLAVLKGAANKGNAMELIAYHLRPEVQARLFDLLVGDAPVSKKASSMLSPEALKWQPNLDNAKASYSTMHIGRRIMRR